MNEVQVIDKPRLSADFTLYDDIRGEYRAIKAGMIAKTVTAEEAETRVRNQIGVIKAMEVDLNARVLEAKISGELADFTPARALKAKGAYNGRQLAPKSERQVGARHVAAERNEAAT